MTRSNCANCKGVPIGGCINKLAVVENAEGYQYLTCTKCDIVETAKAAKTAAEIINRAGIPKIFRNVRATNGTFRINAGNKKAVLAAESSIIDNSGLYLYGDVGVGKTMLACIIANERAYLGKRSYFATVPDLLEDLRDFSNAERREIKMNTVKNVGCLIIDDLGAENPTNWSADQLFAIINHRYNENLQTIITSNFDFDKIIDRMPYYTGDRIVRRIKAICTPVLMR